MQRRTRQRDAIRRALEQAPGPLLPHEVHARARRDVSRLGIATVYRNLAALVDRGVVRQVDLPGDSSRYELVSEEHHHYFSCNECHRVYELDRCFRRSLDQLTPPGFVLEDHEIVLYGRCDDCV